MIFPPAGPVTSEIPSRSLGFRNGYTVNKEREHQSLNRECEISNLLVYLRTQLHDEASRP